MMIKNERNVSIFIAKMNGFSLRAIGRQYGLSHTRVRQICWKIARQQQTYSI